jgi:hypothetical protein
MRPSQVTLGDKLARSLIDHRWASEEGAIAGLRGQRLPKSGGADREF